MRGRRARDVREALAEAAARRSTPCGRPRRLLENTLRRHCLRGLAGRTRHSAVPGHRDAAGRPSAEAAIGARGLRKAFGDFRGGQGARASRCDTARCTACSAPTARARPPRSRCSAACSSRRAARCSWPARAATSALGSVRQQVGYMSQKFSLYDDLHDRREPRLLRRRLRRAAERSAAQQDRWVLDVRRPRQAGRTSSPGSLPGGWKQRVAFGAAIMHEPTRALPRRADLRRRPDRPPRASGAMINRLADWGTAILVTTHYLEEAEQCNRLGLHGGRRAGRRGHAERRSKAAQGGRVLEIRVERRRSARSHRLKQTMEPLAGVAVRRSAATSSSTATRRPRRRRAPAPGSGAMASARPGGDRAGLLAGGRFPRHRGAWRERRAPRHRRAA